MKQFFPLFLYLLLVACTGGTQVASLPSACNPADNITHVNGDNLCLVIKTFGESRAAPALYVVLHGDTSDGGPSDYHYAVAQALQAGGPAGSVAVAMIRPGYYDYAGNTSTGSNYGRRDSYTAENIAAIADGIRTLKTVHGARRVILVGHSGGAAIAGVILGEFPGLADGAVLVSCPCNITAWRLGRGGPWTQSESPSDYVSRISEGTHVVAVSGEADTNTGPALSRDYVETLKRYNIDARFEIIPNATHNSAFRSPAVLSAALAEGAGG
jgi:pimeloyl-ACP methyl ester carboxylesterase